MEVWIHLCHEKKSQRSIDVRFMKHVKYLFICAKLAPFLWFPDYGWANDMQIHELCMYYAI